MVNEKRSKQRYAFSKDDKIRITLVPKKGGPATEALLLNISQEGLGLAALKKNSADTIIKDADLFLESISEKNDFLCLEGHSVKIKWILDYEHLENYGVGCEFIQPDEVCIHSIVNRFQ